MTTTAQAPARSTTVDLALVAALAAVIAVCSILPAINVSTFAPITLQTFGVLLAGALLGARRGLLAVLLWVAVGAAGLPVFANGKSGLPVLVGPTGGYYPAYANTETNNGQTRADPSRWHDRRDGDVRRGRY